MKTKDSALSTRVRFAALVAVASAALMAAGCEGMKSNADSTGNFGPGGTTSEANPDSVPDCYDGTGSGQGGFGGWKNQFTADEAAPSASRIFDTLLRDTRTLGYGGEGEAPSRC